MFRALIVEDMKEVCALLKDYLQDCFVNADGRSEISVETAYNVEDGRRLIAEAADARLPYHTVVLDFKLPTRAGDNAEIDESLCLAVCRHAPSTLVAHLTAYREDEVVQDHLRRVHLEEIGPAAFVLHKLDIDYPSMLTAKLKAFLYGRRVGECLNMLFHGHGALSTPPRSRSRLERSITHEIAETCRLISTYWHGLDERLREDVRLYFEVEEGDSWPRVTLARDSRNRTADSPGGHQPGVTIPDLPFLWTTKHFAIHYGLRNPEVGRGLGPDGVRDRSQIAVYAKALELLYETMRGEPWGRLRPVTGADRLTHVYVFDAHPCTSVDDGGVPFIVLSSRSDETSTQAELHRATAEAVHEATHVFNFTQRPFGDTAWEWFDEGFAVFMEYRLAAGEDYFRYLADWIDRPELPLDDPRAKYQASMFIRYLARQPALGLNFVNRVWTESGRDETPLEALSRLMPAGRKVASPAPDEDDLFGAGYCLDFYFMWNQESTNLAPEVFLRFGERAVSESIKLRPGQQAGSAGVLNHLACHYYRFYLQGGATGVRAELYAGELGAPTTLKAQLAVVTKEKQRAEVFSLRESVGGAGPLSAAVVRVDPDSLDHVVLVVSNCGDRSRRLAGEEHDDGKDYVFNVVAS